MGNKKKNRSKKNAAADVSSSKTPENGSATNTVAAPVLTSTPTPTPTPFLATKYDSKFSFDFKPTPSSSSFVPHTNLNPSPTPNANWFSQKPEIDSDASSSSDNDLTSSKTSVTSSIFAGLKRENKVDFTKPSPQSTKFLFTQIPKPEAPKPDLTKASPPARVPLFPYIPKYEVPQIDWKPQRIVDTNFSFTGNDFAPGKVGEPTNWQDTNSRPAVFGETPLLFNWEQRAAHLQSEVLRLNAEVGTLHKGWEKTKDQLAELDKNNDELRETNLDICTAQEAEVKELEKSIAEKQFEQSLANFHTNMANEKYDKVVKEKKDLEEKLATKEKDFKDALEKGKKEKNELGEKLAAKEKDVEDALDKAKEAENERESMRDRILKGRQEIEDNMNNLRATEVDLRRQLQKSEDERKSLKNEITRLEENAQTREEHISSAEDAYVKMQKEVENLTDQINTLRSENSSNERDRVNDKQYIERAEASNKEKDVMIAELTAAVARERGLNNNYKTKAEKADQTNEENAKLKKDAQGLLREHKTLQADLANMKVEVEEAKEMKIKHEPLLKTLEEVRSENRHLRNELENALRRSGMGSSRGSTALPLRNLGEEFEDLGDAPDESSRLIEDKDTEETEKDAKGEESGEEPAKKHDEEDTESQTQPVTQEEPGIELDGPVWREDEEEEPAPQEAPRVRVITIYRDRPASIPEEVERDVIFPEGPILTYHSDGSVHGDVRTGTVSQDVGVHVGLPGQDAGTQAGRERTIEVPGPERIVERIVEVHVPGPERVVEVPGPERIIERIVEVPVPGPERTIELAVPGLERIVRTITIGQDAGIQVSPPEPGPEQIIQVPNPVEVMEVLVGGTGSKRAVEVAVPVRDQERIIRFVTRGQDAGTQTTLPVPTQDSGTQAALPAPGQDTGIQVELPGHVPAPEPVIQVPGPQQVVVEVPGPVRIQIVEIPGPVRYIQSPARLSHNPFACWTQVDRNFLVLLWFLLLGLLGGLSRGLGFSRSRLAPDGGDNNLPPFPPPNSPSPQTPSFHTPRERERPRAATNNPPRAPGSNTTQQPIPSPLDNIPSPLSSLQQAEAQALSQLLPPLPVIQDTREVIQPGDNQPGTLNQLIPEIPPVPDNREVIQPAEGTTTPAPMPAGALDAVSLATPSPGRVVQGSGALAGTAFMSQQVPVQPVGDDSDDSGSDAGSDHGGPAPVPQPAVPQPPPPAPPAAPQPRDFLHELGRMLGQEHTTIPILPTLFSFFIHILIYLFILGTLYERWMWFSANDNTRSFLEVMLWNSRVGFGWWDTVVETLSGFLLVVPKGLGKEAEKVVVRVLTSEGPYFSPIATFTPYPMPG